MIKYVFSIPLRSLQGLINSLFQIYSNVVLVSSLFMH
nr:transposase [Candidatus Enterovibrio luxaltus]